MTEFKPLASLPQGAICDLVTPFRGDQLDEASFADLAEWQIDSGISGLLVSGPAGEPWALTDDERTTLIRLAVAVAGGRIPVIAGTGTNCTETTVARTAEAKNMGATAAYVVTPYYSKPAQEGLFRHYEAIADRMDLPLIVGVAPQRTAIDLSPRTLEQLATLPSVAGIADETGDIARLAAMPVALRQRFALYSGHDLTAMPFTLMGGRGVISSAANLVPRLTVALHQALATGNLQSAQSLQERLSPLFQALEREPSPAAIKYGLSLLRGMSDDVRLPLTPIVAETTAAFRMALAPVLCKPAPARRQIL
ncbi:4-hydroxy-tetrahydrodipicolinate synthase [Rhizobium herbae]|uniref:4-hydroxy-tetrahydrodipicolinate synthase n=1 Tax=Rhizobium herbae TaxID=508661 RepID=A0ABS4EG82_9HYPH|nr:4-hydroxy-tetrahydrodipicolinate synthase [Rhizobium herbae]MBP1856929.1 4-hydroxy-tetrahydrodipicolinate synthase [Rhizobium herbae]